MLYPNIFSFFFSRTIFLVRNYYVSVDSVNRSDFVEPTAVIFVLWQLAFEEVKCFILACVQMSLGIAKPFAR